MAGNAPSLTSPQYISDELVAVESPGDFAALSPRFLSLATGRDGSFAAGSPWVLASASVDFQAQGVAPQCVVELDGPPSSFPGSGGYLYAVESVAGPSATLRLLGLAAGVGQPPAPAAGLSLVGFRVPTLRPQIDQATYRLKDRHAIDEAIFWRSSGWLYQGAEDAYRVFRDAVVFEALSGLFESQARGDGSGGGDWYNKARLYRKRADDAVSRIYARWGPFGNSAQPINAFGARISR